MVSILSPKPKQPDSDEISERRFLELLRREWEPGFHIGIAAPTRWGKTWLASRIFRLREWVVVYCMKQEDDTIEQYKDFRILDSWKDRNWKDQHCIVWPYARTLDEAKEIKYREAKILLDSVFIERNWTLGIDDLNDLCYIGLKGDIGMMLRLCGSQKTSIVVNYQRPFGIIQEALSQTYFTIAGYMKDRRDIDRVAESCGLNPKVLAQMNSRLGRFDAIVTRRMDEPLIVRRKG